LCYVFFFSSRRRHTRFSRDWSSDVCSSDLFYSERRIALDKIYLNEMEFYGYHGVLPEETKLGQRFRVNIVAETDFREAGLNDNLELTVSYADIFLLCKEIVEGKPYMLIE